MRIDFDARLAASTVLVDGREWCQGTLTNLATNPSFEAAGSTVEVRRNLHPNPDLQVNSSGWGEPFGVESARLADAGTVDIPTGFALRVFSTAGVTSASAVFLSGAIPVTPGETITISFWVISNGFSIPFSPRVWWGGGTYFVAPTFTATSEYTRCSFTVTVPAGETTMRIRPLLPNGLTSAQALRFRRALVEAAPQVRPYFDGSFSPDTDLTPSWAGAVGATASVLSGRLAAQLQAPTLSQGIPYQTGDNPVSGSNALRFLIRTTSTAGVALAQPGVATTDTLYTMVMWVRASRAITVHPRIRAATTGVDGVTLEPGVWTLVRTTVTAGAGSDAQTGLLLDGTSGHQIGDTVDVGDFTIVEGAHPDLMPFHGSTVNPEWPGVTYAWTGPLNASTSTRTTPAIDRIEVDRDPGTGWVPVRGGRRDVINGFVALTDHEMPLHQEVRYRVAGYSGDTYVGAFTGTVDTSIPGWCGVFVKIPANPNATVMVDPTNSIDIDSSTQGGSYDIAAGSSIAVAAWSGVNASRFTLNAITKTDVDSAQMRALLQKNRVILLQGPDWAPFPPGWYYVESVSEGLRGDGAIKQGRKWSLSLVSTGIPSGDTAGVAGASWNQIRAKYATWDELKTANSTWFDVLQGGN